MSKLIVFDEFVVSSDARRVKLSFHRGAPVSAHEPERSKQQVFDCTLPTGAARELAELLIRFAARVDVTRFGDAPAMSGFYRPSVADEAARIERLDAQLSMSAEALAVIADMAEREELVDAQLEDDDVEDDNAPGGGLQ